MSNSTAMCHHAKCDIKSSFHKPSFAQKKTTSTKTEENWFSPIGGKIPGTHLQERPRYWVRTSRTSLGLDPAPLPAWKKSSPSENKHCYSTSPLTYPSENNLKSILMKEAMSPSRNRTDPCSQEGQRLKVFISIPVNYPLLSTSWLDQMGKNYLRMFKILIKF